MNDRVVITGIGVLSPIGMGKEAFWQGLERSHAIKPITLFDTSDLKCTQAAEITDFNVKDHLSQRGLKYLSRSAQLACAATALALEDAALDLSAVDPPEVGVVIGTAFGNVNSMIAFDKEAWLEGPRFVNPMTFPNTVVNSPAGYISVLFGLTGLNATISTGRSSSLEALKYAAECLKREEAQWVLAGGCEELSEFVHLGFLKAGQLSGSKGDGIEKPAPLDRRRNGFVLGEGAVILSLERSDHAQSRGAHILAEIAGYGDAYAPAGSGFDGFEVKAEAEAMRRALLSSRLDPEDIGFISLSANGSVLGDRIETLAIGQVFGDLAEKIPVCAIKSKIGECYGASGVFQVAAAVLSMDHDLVPGIANFQEGDADSPLGGVSGQNRLCECNAVLINSFDGRHNNSSLVVKRYSP